MRNRVTVFKERYCCNVVAIMLEKRMLVLKKNWVQRSREIGVQKYF
jgi:hypothetical protein